MRLSIYDVSYNNQDIGSVRFGWDRVRGEGSSMAPRYNRAEGITPAIWQPRAEGYKVREIEEGKEGEIEE